MTAPHVAILSEGLAGDLRPICYGRSTWDVPFLGRPLFARALRWLEHRQCKHVILLDDTPGQWLRDLAHDCPISTPVQHLDARHERLEKEKLHALLGDVKPELVYLLKPSALIDPDMDGLEEFHFKSEAQATFALTRLEPGSLSWPYIPACRMDEYGCLLEVDKLRRTDALGSASLDNVLGTTAPSRPREFWAPRNVALLSLDVVMRLPARELLAPLAGLAREMVADGIACYGSAMKGHWWPASTSQELMTANREAIRMSATTTGGVAKDDSQVAQDVEIASGAKIVSSIVGMGTSLDEGATLQNSVVANDCKIGARSSVRDCFLGTASTVPDDIHLSGSVVGDGEIQNLARGVPPGGFFIDGLRQVDEEAVIAYWKDHVPLYGRSPKARVIKTLSKGIDNNVYHLFDENRHFVLKRRLDCHAHPLIREYHVLRILADMHAASASRNGVRSPSHRQGDRGPAAPRPPSAGFAPRPYLVDLRPEIRVAPCIVMEFVRGTRVPEGGITPRIAAAIGRACQEVHGVPVADLLRDLPELSEQSYPDLLTYVTELAFQYSTFLDARRHHGGADDALGEHLHRLVKCMQEMAEQENAHWSGYVPRALCQGDLREFNMLVREDDPDAVVLLDWERCGVDDPAYDIGWFLALANLSDEAERAFRQEYGAGPAGDKTFWQRADSFRLADVLTWPLHLLQLVEDFRENRLPGADENTINTYEEDAYRALAMAFNTLARSERNGFSDGHSAQTIREMGNLFA